MTISCATANFSAMRTFYNFRRGGLIFIWNEENKIQRRKVAWSKPKQEDKDLCFLPLNANISPLSHLISFQMDSLRLDLNMFTLSPFLKKKSSLTNTLIWTYMQSPLTDRHFGLEGVRVGENKGIEITVSSWKATVRI